MASGERLEVEWLVRRRALGSARRENWLEAVMGLRDGIDHPHIGAPGPGRSGRLGSGGHLVGDPRRDPLANTPVKPTASGASAP